MKRVLFAEFAMLLELQTFLENLLVLERAVGHALACGTLELDESVL